MWMCQKTNNNNTIQKLFDSDGNLKIRLNTLNASHFIIFLLASVSYVIL